MKRGADRRRFRNWLGRSRIALPCRWDLKQSDSGHKQQYVLKNPLVQSSDLDEHKIANHESGTKNSVFRRARDLHS